MAIDSALLSGAPTNSHLMTCFVKRPILNLLLTCNASLFDLYCFVSAYTATRVGMQLN